MATSTQPLSIPDKVFSNPAPLLPGPVGPLLWYIYEATSGTWLSSPGCREFTEDFNKAVSYVNKDLAVATLEKQKSLTLPNDALGPYETITFKLKKQGKWYGFGRKGREELARYNHRARAESVYFRGRYLPIALHQSPLKLSLLAFQTMALSSWQTDAFLKAKSSTQVAGATGAAAALSDGAIQEPSQLRLEFGHE